MARRPIYLPWTEADDELLQRLWCRPLTLAAIGRRMHRNTETIRAKAKVLGLPPKTRSVDCRYRSSLSNTSAWL
jgi:hypothetical protein